VKRVDGRSVTDQSTALDALIGPGIDASLPRLRALADQNARYNLGHIERNFNDPTWVLRVFDPDIRPRFRFTSRGTDTIEYRERDTPTLIRGRGAKLVTGTATYSNFRRFETSGRLIVPKPDR
jgi:hypothetical protein